MTNGMSDMTYSKTLKDSYSIALNRASKFCRMLPLKLANFDDQINI